MGKREIAKTWASRTLLTAKAGLSAAKVAGKVAIEKVRDAASGDGEDGDTDALVARLDELKGLSMKVGQMASLAENLPPKLQAALARLQSGGSGLDAETVHAVLREAYGRPVGEVFAAFEDAPFAAASIGQVHRARAAWGGGETDVAVKIQYPGIEDGIVHDLRNLGSLRFLLVASSFGTRRLLDELRERLVEECDYRQEAAYQEHFRAAFADRPEVVVPEVALPYTRKNVLVTRLLAARRFQAFRDGASDEERGRAGVILFRTSLWAILGMGMFNGDPHPGNYLFPDGPDGRWDGRVAFLDYGCVRVFEPHFVEAWKRFARSLLDEDRKAFPEAIRAMGLVGSSRFDDDAAFEMFSLVYLPMKSPRFRFDQDFSKRSFEALTVRNPNLLRMDIPPHLAFSWRLNWGLFSVLADLRAEGDFRTPFREAVEAPVPRAVRPPPVAVPEAGA